MQLEFLSVFPVIPLGYQDESRAFFIVQAMKINKMGKGLKAKTKIIPGKIGFKFLF
jgi:hypothetical protein